MENSIYKIIHLPKTNTPLKFNLRIGGGQLGRTQITIGEAANEIKEGDFTINLGGSDSLDGKEIKFDVMISDVNPSSNKLLVTVGLEGMQSSSPWTMSKTVSDGGSYTFFGTVEFYK